MAKREVSEFDTAVVERVIQVLNDELKYGSIDEELAKSLSFCVESLEGLL